MTAAQVAVFVASSIRLAMPLVLAGTGEMVSQRAGLLNLSLEGMMLSSAFAAVWAASTTGSVLAGVAFGLAVALTVGALQAVLSVTLRANQVITGLGLNILALGITTYLNRELLPGGARNLPALQAVSIPGLREIPFVGEGLFRQHVVAWGGLAVVLVIWWALRHTAWGLSVDAAGENPHAADQAGIPVARIRFGAVLLTSAMAGLAGVAISLGDVGTFTEGITSGRGYLAIATVIVGSWVGYRTLLACLLFGAATAFQFQAASFGIDAPTAVFQMLPYVLALLTVVGMVGRRRAPSALTVPFVRNA